MLTKPRSVRRAEATLVAGMLLSIAGTTATLAADNLISVDLNHPDFARVRSAAPAGLAAGERARLDKLKVPVLVPDPGTTARAIGAGAATPPPAILTDDDNPVWYHAETDLGGVTITVEADLRIQHEFPSNFPVYDSGGSSQRGVAPEAPPPLHGDSKSEEGMESQVGQYTLTRYNVPYTVTIICTDPQSDKCKSLQKMGGDDALLRLVNVPTP